MPKDELPSLDDLTENPVELPSVDEFITEEKVVEELPSVDEYVVDIEEKVITILLDMNMEKEWKIMMLDTQQPNQDHIVQLMV